MSDWITALIEACKPPSSQSKVALKLGVSVTMVNQVIKGAYKANLDRIEGLVRGTYMRQMVCCPVLGEITGRRCLDEQVRKLAATNPQRVQLWRACRSGCAHSKQGEAA